MASKEELKNLDKEQSVFKMPEMKKPQLPDAIQKAILSENKKFLEHKKPRKGVGKNDLSYLISENMKRRIE